MSVSISISIMKHPRGIGGRANAIEASVVVCSLDGARPAHSRVWFFGLGCGGFGTLRVA